MHRVVCTGQLVGAGRGRAAAATARQCTCPASSPQWPPAEHQSPRPPSLPLASLSAQSTCQGTGLQCSAAQTHTKPVHDSAGMLMTMMWATSGHRSRQVQCSVVAKGHMLRAGHLSPTHQPMSARIQTDRSRQTSCLPPGHSSARRPVHPSGRTPAEVCVRCVQLHGELHHG